MFAISNNELAGKKKAGKTATCPKCKKKHIIEYGTDAKTKKISKTLGFVDCGKNSYLVSVAGKLLD